MLPVKANYYQPNSFTPYSGQINPLVLPPYAARPIAAPFYTAPLADTLPVITPIKSGTYSSYSEAMAATGLASIIKHENSSVTTLLDSFLTLNDEQARPNNEVEASNTELTVISEMPKISVSRALKVAIGKGYVTLLKTGTASGEKSRYRLNLPFCFVDTKRGHNKYPQNVPTTKNSYEQTKLDLNGKIEVSENGGYKGWVQNDTTSDTALTNIHAQGQTHAQVRDSIFRDSINNINSNKTISRNNRIQESRVGESERIQAHAQGQTQMSAPVSTPEAVSTRARSSKRSRAYISDTLPMQLTLNLNITGLSGQTHTLTAAPGVTVNITPTEQAQPITDHFVEVTEMVVTTVAVADAAISRGPSVAVAPDATAAQASELTEAGDYSYNLPVIENATQPVQTAASTVSASDNVVAASEFPKHVTSYQQLESKPWSPHFLKVECSDALKQTITDFSQLFGDTDHLNSNITQVANLFNSVQEVNSRYSTWEFIELMQECRELTYQFAVLRPGEKAPPPGQQRNRMAYFFKTLRDKTGQVVAEFEKAKAGNAEAKANPITVKLPQTGKAVVETNPAKMVANSPALNKFKNDIEPKMQAERPTVTTTSNDNYSAPATAPIAKLEEKEELTEPEVEFAGETKTANAVRQVTPTMRAVISSNDKAVADNFNDFGSYIVDGVLYAKFYRQGGPCDVSRWATWLKPYGISRVEVI